MTVALHIISILLASLGIVFAGASGLAQADKDEKGAHIGMGISAALIGIALSLAFLAGRQ